MIYETGVYLYIFLIKFYKYSLLMDYNVKEKVGEKGMKAFMRSDQMKIEG